MSEELPTYDKVIHFTPEEAAKGWAIRQGSRTSRVALLYGRMYEGDDCPAGDYLCHLPTKPDRLQNLIATLERFLLVQEGARLPTDDEIAAGLNDETITTEQYLDNLNRIRTGSKS